MMAVRTHLPDRNLRERLRRFPIGELIEARGLSTGSTCVNYQLNTTRGRYILRILENRTETDARFEESLLRHLIAEGLTVPHLLLVAGADEGSAMVLDAKRQLSVFRVLPGRRLGVFEVSAEHVRQIGGFLGAMHQAARCFPGRRRSRFGPTRLLHLLSRCLKSARLADVKQDLDLLQREAAGHVWPRGLPSGTVHGGLRIDRARFAGGELSGVVGFHGACSAPYLYDLAVALCDWAFSGDAFVEERARAMLRGYETVRPLRPLERAHLHAMCRYAIVRMAVERLVEFELRRAHRNGHGYCDYRHFMARLWALGAAGPAAFDRVLAPALDLQSQQI